MGSLWVVATAVAFWTSEAAVDGPGPPTPDGEARVIEVGFHIVDFSRITAREETFDVTGHLKLRWRDPRLANGEKTNRVWIPKIHFDNAAEAPRFHGDPLIDVTPDGVVTSRAILSCRFSTPLDLRRFPFDDQNLIVRISLADDVAKARFIPLEDAMHMHDDVFITDWSLLNQDYKIVTRRYHPNGSMYSVLEYRVQVDRRSTFYFWRVLLPLTLLSLIPGLVFWFEPTNLQPQISTCIGTLIAMLTFGYSVDFALPKVAYLTMIDRHAMIGFLFATAATIGVTLVHQSVASNAIPAALRLQKRLRVLYPAGYLLAIFLSFVLFLTS